MNIDEWLKCGKPWNVILHGDCMDLMKDIPDKYFDLAVVDPPYGIGMSKNINTITGGVKFVPKSWDNSIPDKKYFDELFRISQNQIIWGGNYFIEHLNNTPCFIVWDKNNGSSLFADCEIAWTSFISPIRLKKVHWCGSAAKHETKLNKIHPTQKPVALYRWILQNYAKPNDKIIDTHSGSASLACACHLEGFDFLAIEKDEDYHRDSVKRFEELKSQGRLFT